MGHLDLSLLIGGLAMDMETTLEYLSGIQRETNTEEDKISGRQIKVLGFQMRILTSVCREYESFVLGTECCVALHSLITAICRNCPQNSSTWFHSETKSQLSGNALLSLISALLLQVNFSQYILSSTPEGDSYLSLLKTYFVIGEALSRSEQDISSWFVPTDDNRQQSLLHKLLENFPPDCEHDSIDLREEFYSAASALIVACPVINISDLEKTLLSYTLGSKYPDQTFLAIDLWVLLARRGGAQLTYQHCAFLADLLCSVTITPATPCVSYLFLLLRRLLRNLPEHLRAKLAKVCSADVCSRVLPSFYQAHIDIEHVEQWENLASISGQDALHLNASLQRLSYADLSALPKAPSCLVSLWSFLMEENLEHTNSFTILQSICTSICHALKSTVSKCSNILKILDLMSKTLRNAKENRWSCLDELMLSMLTILRGLASRSFTDANQKSILDHISDLFFRLLAEDCPIVRQASMEAFAFFAEQTSHESVVADSLQRDETVQERVVAYLDQISDSSDLESCKSVDFNGKDAFLSAQREMPQDATPIDVGKWPVVHKDSSNVNPPADKKPRLNNHPIVPHCAPSDPTDPRSIYVRLEQNVSQLEDCMPLPFVFRSKLNTLCRRLKLLADTTSS